MRYYRLCDQFDVPVETRHVVSAMVSLLLDYDPLFAQILEEHDADPLLRHAAAMAALRGAEHELAPEGGLHGRDRAGHAQPAFHADDDHVHCAGSRSC